MEADYKVQVFGLVGDRGRCKNRSPLGWSKRLELVRHWAGFRWEDCKQQAGVLVGGEEKDFPRVALVECRRLQL